MSQPTRLASYESSWMDLADKLHRHGAATLEVDNSKLATTLRHRFYGFRNALAKAEPSNPYVTTLMESRVTIRPGRPSWQLIFERDPFGQMLRDSLAKSFPNEKPPASPQIQQPSPHEAPLEAPQKVDMLDHDKAILDFLNSTKMRGSG